MIMIIIVLYMTIIIDQLQPSLFVKNILYLSFLALSRMAPWTLAIFQEIAFSWHNTALTVVKKSAAEHSSVWAQQKCASRVHVSRKGGTCEHTSEN